MADSGNNFVSLAVYNRMPVYLKALLALKRDGKKFVSSVILADYVRENPSLVKKDLSYAITSVGKPKVGYDIDSLILDVENFLGYNNVKDAVLVGVGKLGQALMGYHGFDKYGLNIVAGFDIDDNVIGKVFNGKKVFPTGSLAGLVSKLNIKIGILTTTQDHAQPMADLLVQSGIRAIWNFTPVHLTLPDSVAVKNEDMASSLAILSKQLKEILFKESN